MSWIRSIVRARPMPAPSAGRGCRWPVALLAAWLGLGSSGCTGPSWPVSLSVEQADGELSLTLEGAPGRRVAIVAGRPMVGAEAIPVGSGGLRLVPAKPTPENPYPHILLQGALPPEGRVAFRLRPVRFQDRPDPCVIQAMSWTEDGPGAGTAILSRPFVVRHGAGALTLEDADRVFLRSSLPGALAFVLLTAAALVVLRLLRWPRVPPLCGHVLLVGMLILVVAHRIASRPGVSGVVTGFQAPPLIWPGAWALGDDVLERELGPGFRALLEASRAAGAPREEISIWFTPARAGEELLAIHLSHQLDDAPVRPLDPDAAPRGLVMLLDGRRRGTVLAETPVGVLARIDG